MHAVREPIEPGSAWDLGHLDGSLTQYAGVEHRRCNRATASHRYPEVPSEVLDGAEVSGVIVFPAMDPSLGLRVPMEGYSESSDIGEYGSLKWEFKWAR